MARVLLVTWNGDGLVPVEIGLARRLQEAGHDVSVLADPPIEDEARAAGCNFIPWTTAPHATSGRPEDAVIKDWQYQNPLKGMKVYLRDFLADPSPRWAADVDAVLAERTFDVVVVDFALPAAMIPVEARHIPLVGVMPNCWILPTKGIPPIGPGFAPATNPITRARDAVLRKITTRLFNRALPALNATRHHYGLAPVASTADQMTAGRTLVCSSPVFDFTSPYQPATAVYVGPILDDPAWTARWASPWSADDDRPLVLVGFSSGYQNQTQELNTVADALAALPVRALVTVGPSIPVDTVPSRSGAGDVVVVDHAPHQQILPHASAIVTHCGHGTTMKALVAGVPMVCMPMGRDQNDTAARVVHHGAGIRLKRSAPAHAITAAVREVLDQPQYRQAAAALGARIAAGEGCVDPVAAIEAALSSPVSSPGRPEVARSGKRRI